MSFTLSLDPAFSGKAMSLDSKFVTETSLDDLTTIYVYELALKLRNQFDALIQLHGPDPYEGVVPVVVRTLEQLECTTKQCDMTRAEVEELKYTIERLKADKLTKAVEKEKYQKELELIEESWNGEVKVQRDLITHLQTEIQRLNDIMKNKMADVVDDRDQTTCREVHLEAEVVNLKDRLHRQRDEIKQLEEQLNERIQTLDDLQSQLERARKQNCELRRKTSFSQGQLQGLLEDKSNLESQLREKEMRLARIKDRQLRRSAGSNGDASDEEDYGDKSQTPLSDAELCGLVSRLSVDNKMIIDLNDIDQPRFTLSDVNEIMSERNRLRERVNELEEQLKQFLTTDESPDVEVNETLSDEDKDAPVQGPINREPEEKLFPERFRVKGSSIRKLFSQFINKLEAQIKITDITASITSDVDNNHDEDDDMMMMMTIIP